MRSSRIQQTPMNVQVGTPDLDGLIENVMPRRGIWLSPFDRQGRRFRSQKERSNRRKAQR
jgi:hypothetical protein